MIYDESNQTWRFESFPRRFIPIFLSDLNHQIRDFDAMFFVFVVNDLIQWSQMWLNQSLSHGKVLILQSFAFSKK